MHVIKCTRLWVVCGLLVVLLVCTTRAQRLRQHLRNICPFPCECANGELYCDNMELQQFPYRIPENVNKVNMKDNHIRELRTEQLQYITNVTHLFLRHNRIRTIENDAFRSLSRMKAITFRDNRIRHLPADVFKGLVNLEQLSLRNNRLRYVEHIFDGLKRLRLLSLGDNKIRKITKDTFKTNKYLFVLDLHNNSIRAIGRKALHSLTYLKYLILRDNPLHSVNLDFRLNYHLELLDFTNCKLTEMIKGLPASIRDLRISENRITQIRKKDFRGTQKIRFLFLVHNNISQVDNDTFSHMEILYDIHLSNNSLHSVPKRLPQSLHGFFAINNSIEALADEDFDGNTNLEFLALRLNKIHTIGQKSFQNLDKLKSLDLSQNDIIRLEPEGFMSTQNLELLDLSHNPLDEADRDCFKGLANLHILQMSGMSKNSKLQPSIFEGTQNLLYFDLSNSSKVASRFAQSPFLLDYISTVEDLNLMHDNIFTLPPSFPNHFPRLKLIKLVDNPWHCDRSIYWLTRWMNNNSLTFFEEDAMLCRSPPKLSGRRIASLVLSELRNPFRRRGKIKPDVDVIDIPFTLGKNYTISMGDKDGLQNDTDYETESMSETFTETMQDATEFIDYDFGENSETGTTIEEVEEEEEVEEPGISSYIHGGVHGQDANSGQVEELGLNTVDEAGEQDYVYAANYGEYDANYGEYDADIDHRVHGESEHTHDENQNVWGMDGDLESSTEIEDGLIKVEETRNEDRSDATTSNSKDTMLNPILETTASPLALKNRNGNGGFYLAVDDKSGNKIQPMERHNRQYTRYDENDKRLSQPLELQSEDHEPRIMRKEKLIEKLRNLALKSKKFTTDALDQNPGKYNGRNNRKHVQPLQNAKSSYPTHSRPTKGENFESHKTDSGRYNGIREDDHDEIPESEIDENDWSTHSNELMEITRPTMAEYKKSDRQTDYNHRPSSTISEVFPDKTGPSREGHKNQRYNRPLLLDGENLPREDVHTWRQERHKIRHQRRRMPNEPTLHQVTDILMDETAMYVAEVPDSSSGESSGELHYDSLYYD